MNVRRWFSLAAAVAGTASVGCSSTEFAEIEGTVTSEGKPLPGIAVVFVADAPVEPGCVRAVGITDPQGKFRVATDGGRSGAAVGTTYRVCAIDTEAGLRPAVGAFPPELVAEAKARWLSLTPKASSAPKVSRVPLDYTDVVRSPLKPLEIRSGTQDYSIDIPAIR